MPQADRHFLLALILFFVMIYDCINNKRVWPAIYELSEGFLIELYDTVTAIQ